MYGGGVVFFFVFKIQHKSSKLYEFVVSLFVFSAFVFLKMIRITFNMSDN